MGFRKLDEVVEKLKACGLRAQRGYPMDIMPFLEGTAAAVYLDAITPEYTKVAVQILTPKGGSTCEEGAQIAVDALSEMGATYSVGKISFDNKTGYFTCCVVGTWTTSANCTVWVDGKTLETLVAVSVKKSVSRTMVMDWETEEMVEECRDMGWSITLEEILPVDSLLESDVQEAFDVYIFRPNGKERYQNCKWVQISLESVANGLRRIRVARTWEDRSVFE